MTFRKQRLQPRSTVKGRSHVRRETRGCTARRGSPAINGITEGWKKLKEIIKAHYSFVNRKKKGKAIRNSRKKNPPKSRQVGLVQT